MQGHALERLDLATSSKLRSTQIITSLPHIVSELVQNSLDAGASSVEVGVNREEWSCWVRDNGSGIGKDGVAQVAAGRNGGRYASSKAYDPVSLHSVETFGFRGEALASISDLSCLEISTRTKFAKESRTLILRNGTCLYNGPSVHSRRDATGTNIFVREAFFNVPVRRLAHPPNARTLDLIRREIGTLALAHPRVQFKLCDTSRTFQDGRDRSLVLAIPKTSSSYHTFKHLYGRTLVEHVEHIDSKMGSTHIYGFLSLAGSHSSAYQFLYLNRHVLDVCELHQVIEKKFADSSFAKHALDENGEVSNDDEEGKRRSPRKSIRKPIYVLNVDIPRHQVDNLLEPSKSSVHLQDRSSVVSFLADVIDGFLTKNGFKSQSAPAVIPSRRSTKRSLNTYQSLVCAESPSKKSRSPLNRPSSMGVIIDKGATEEVTWVDPTTKKIYVIDPRTGNSYAREEPAVDTQASEVRHAIKRRISQACCMPNSAVTPEWIMSALSGNEAFSSTETPVWSVPSPTPFQKNEPGYGEERNRTPWKKQFNRTFSAIPKGMSVSNDISSSSFDKRSLEEAEVLGQVDAKFIACLLTVIEEGEDGACNNGPRALVLIDQHAVDERIRVERFLKALCEGFLDRKVGGGVERRKLQSLVPVLLTKFERDRLIQSEHMRNALSDWGLEVEHDPRQDPDDEENVDSAHGTVYFKTVPEVVADKLLAKSGSDLRELVKGFLARLESEGSTFSSQRPSTKDNSTAHGWLSALRDCPRELIDLVNSRACRGAIMFNDVLTDEQCRRLVRQLAQTAFPFQCAHGRPSVVPLTTLRREAAGEERAVDWAKLL